MVFQCLGNFSEKIACSLLFFNVSGVFFLERQLAEVALS